MARWINVATIHFQVTESGGEPLDMALRQFHEARTMLDGTPVDLVVTCEGMESIARRSGSPAESQDKPGALWSAYRAFARDNRCTLAGSLVLQEEGKDYNALVFFGPDGRPCGAYRKTFLTLEELEGGLSPGRGATVVETPAGRLGGAICFDLNFDDLRDGYRRLQPDVLCFASMFHGGHLQKNWAYQCRCFFAAACKDNTSDILDPLGRVLNSTNYYNRVAWARVNLDRFAMHQDQNNRRYAQIRRKYGGRVVIETAPDLGTAVLYSLDESLTAAQIAAEFGLQQIDDYFDRSRQANRQAGAAVPAPALNPPT